MTKHILFLVAALLLITSAPLAAQQRHWVFFRDRGDDAAERLVHFAAEGVVSADALRKRGRDVTIGDLPPSPGYVAAVKATGARIATASRWLNAVSVDAGSSVLERIAALPFVQRIAPVCSWEQPAPLPAPFASRPASLSSYGLDYGFSLEQLEVMRVPKVHDIWIDGTGITIGMLDNGYRWRGHEAMRVIDVRGEYDVINGDTLTENEEGEPYGQDSHGTVTFSALAGFRQGKLIGPAFNAAFYLAKTEVNNSETQIEEDYWVQGIEWLTARGASIVSASLGYSDWDDGTGYSYENGDFDGHTAVTTRAAVEAMRRGVVVVTAMGNEGSSVGSLIAPADADSIIAVGAVDFAGNVAGFSSRGPTNDFRIKPDIVTPGVSVYSATKSGEDTYSRSNGTSMATPLAAGVAALVRSARPELTPVQVRDALRATADNADSPNNARGWGLVDAWDALLHHGMVISTNPKIIWDGAQSTIMAYVISRSPVMRNQVSLKYEAEGMAPGSVAMSLQTPSSGVGEGSGLYVGMLPAMAEGTKVRFSVTASDAAETRTSPYGAPELMHEFTAGETRLLGAEHLLPSSLVLYQNYPNPFSPSETASTFIRYEVPLPGGAVRLEMFDALGRRVQTLVDGFRGAGVYAVAFDNTALSSGVYYYVLTSGETQVLRRMLILQ
ncbi:MAG: S8 family peptidase [Bacteroidetes bacterium]|nr:S8 family peptidase [Bacteroidota bacterium]